MTEAILLAIQAVSFVVIVIIMAVMANTMAMTARERGAEYATLKALGFCARLRRAADLRRIARHRAASAASLGIALTFPVADAFAERMGTLFPVFFVSERDDARCSSRAALVVGVVAAALPGVARGARAHRRRPARGRRDALTRSPWPSLRLHRAQPRGAPAHDGADRGRHGARRLRVRDRADARGRARGDARRDRTARQRRRHPPRGADRSAERRRSDAGGDRREPARHRGRARRAASWCRRSRSC